MRHLADTRTVCKSTMCYNSLRMKLNAIVANRKQCHLTVEVDYYLKCIHLF